MITKPLIICYFQQQIYLDIVNYIFSYIFMHDYSFKIDSNPSPTHQSNQYFQSKSSSAWVEELRKKYDTPTRKKIHDFSLKSSYSKENDQKFSQIRQQQQGSVNSSLQSSRNQGLKLNYKYDEGGKENFRKEEQSVFEKIKQMKKSIMDGSRLKERNHHYQRQANKEFKFENMDKINTKIKRILDCLHESQAKPKEYEHYDRSTQEAKKNLANIQIKQSYSNYQEKKATDSTQQVNKFHLPEKSSTRSKSTLGYGKNYESGKKLDDEICKIQTKIKQFEQQKRKLNISFTPYRHVSNKSFSQAPSEQKDRYKYRIDKSLVLNKEDRMKNVESLEKEEISFGKDDKKQQKQFKIKLIPIENEEIEKQANEGMRERKKKLRQSSAEYPRSKQTITRLINCFSQQAKIDEVLRNNKIWFQSLMKKEKWNQLATLIPHINQQKVKIRFNVTEAQNNPFFSVRDSNCSYRELANSYKESEQYWNKHLNKKFSRRNLQEQGFELTSIDLERKGHIVLEDLVRFLNMQTGTFFRNRDLVLIFRRITGEDKVKFEDFMNAICY